ncbi:MAG: hypothetical protein J1G07_00360 [Clostridiales bacterium]|nr:hypothetical protein [Clostridiales bacterium]
MVKKLNFKNPVLYIKIALIVLLVIIEIIVCAQAFGAVGIRKQLGAFMAVVLCCVALAAMESVSAFAVKNFAVKMVFYGINCALLLTICLLTGFSFLSTLYCIMLTECYMTVEKFKDKVILFGVGCVLFIVSFTIGWVIMNVGASLYDSIVSILSGILFGLMIMFVDFAIVQFIIKFNKTNKELSASLKAEEDSRARLEEVYSQLTQTKVFEERNRIAKDIHDNAGHSMTTVIMQTEAAKLLIDTDPAEAKNRIISANIQARNALEQMRESVHLLAGREQTHTLKDEIEEIVAQTVDGTDIKARVDLDDCAVTPDIHRFICNSVKELIANGIRHGKATAFYIELKQNEGQLKLFVSDNGVGVSGCIEEGFGLKGIRKRAEEFGGSAVFNGEEEEGFESEICVPLKDSEKSENKEEIK